MTEHFVWYDYILPDSTKSIPPNPKLDHRSLIVQSRYFSLPGQSNPGYHNLSQPRIAVCPSQNSSMSTFVKPLLPSLSLCTRPLSQQPSSAHNRTAQHSSNHNTLTHRTMALSRCILRVLLHARRCRLRHGSTRDACHCGDCAGAERRRDCICCGKS